METVDLKQAGYAQQPLLEKSVRMAGTLVTRMLLSVDRVAVTIPKYVEILKDKYDASTVLLAPRHL